MYQTLYPIYDSTIDSQFPDRNEGLDQILTLRKVTTGEPIVVGEEDVFYDTNFNSRILIKFDLTEVSKSISNGRITNDNQFFLTLKATTATNLPLDYTMWVYPVAESWLNGTGFNNSNPQITNGVSWYYKDSKTQASRWLTGSYASNITGSYGTIAGGGTWFTSSYGSQTFRFESADTHIDVTSIVRSWISGSIPNHGFMIKLDTEYENNEQSFGIIQFFSVNSHTIFIPRLEVFWKDHDISGINSFSEIQTDDFVLSVRNLRESYSDSEKAKLRLGIRERYPVATYSTSSGYTLNSKRLPINSYFQIQDVVTDEVIIPFHPSGTLINCDSTGNYFNIDCTSLMPERMYKFVVKSEFEGGDVVRIIDDNFNFKIRRH